MSMIPVPIALAIVLPLLWQDATPGDMLSGLATYMKPGKIEAAAQRMKRSLEGVVGGVALNRKGDIGRIVWIERASVVYGPFRVVDCARAGEHYEKRERQGRIVEVSYELADEWGIVGVGPTAVAVWFIDPRILAAKAEPAGGKREAY